MSHVVRVRPAAERDLALACAWYDRRQPGLGQALLEELDEAFNRLSVKPLIPTEYHLGFRRILHAAQDLRTQFTS